MSQAGCEQLADLWVQRFCKYIAVTGPVLFCQIILGKRQSARASSSNSGSSSSDSSDRWRRSGASWVNLLQLLHDNVRYAASISTNECSRSWKCQHSDLKAAIGIYCIPGQIIGDCRKLSHPFDKTTQCSVPATRDHSVITTHREAAERVREEGGVSRQRERERAGASRKEAERKHGEVEVGRRHTHGPRGSLASVHRGREAQQTWRHLDTPTQHALGSDSRHPCSSICPIFELYQKKRPRARIRVLVRVCSCLPSAQ